MTTEDSRQEVDKAARVLVESGAKEVYIVDDDRYAPESELELAVSGLPPERFFSAVVAAMLAISCTIYVTDMDNPDPRIDYIMKKGKLRRVA